MTPKSTPKESRAPPYMAQLGSSGLSNRKTPTAVRRSQSQQQPPATTTPDGTAAYAS